MTPHRAPNLARYAIGSLRSIGAAPVDSWGALGAAVAAGISWAFGPANAALLLVMGLTMLLDLVVGSLKAVIDPLASFEIQKLYGGILGKLFRVMLVPAASLIDWLYIASPLPLPADYAAAFPVTAFVTLGLAAAEITSTLNKFRDGGVAPGLIAAMIRHLDRMKAGAEPPTRRHYDAPAIAAEHEREEGTS